MDLAHTMRQVSGTVSFSYSCLLKDMCSCENQMMACAITKEGQGFQQTGFINSSMSEDRENWTSDYHCEKCQSLVCMTVQVCNPTHGQ